MASTGQLITRKGVSHGWAICKQEARRHEQPLCTMTVMTLATLRVQVVRADQTQKLDRSHQPRGRGGVVTCAGGFNNCCTLSWMHAGGEPFQGIQIDLSHWRWTGVDVDAGVDAGGGQRREEVGREQCQRQSPVLHSRTSNNRPFVLAASTLQLLSP